MLSHVEQCRNERLGFTMWLAGPGVKGGQVIGATDELGSQAVEDPCHVSDLHATILHLMGLDHTKLTYFHQGLELLTPKLELGSFQSFVRGLARHPVAVSTSHSRS